MMTGPDAVGRKPDGSSSVPPVVDAAPAAVVTPRSRALRLAWIAIAVILVGVVVLVTYALTRPPSTPRVVHRPATSSDVISALGEVPSSMFDSVGVTVPATR